MSEQPEQEQPALISSPSDNAATKQKCMVCGALLAKTFIDVKDVSTPQLLISRIHLCQADAYTMLRMACLHYPLQMQMTLQFMNEQIYGKIEE